MSTRPGSCAMNQLFLCNIMGALAVKPGTGRSSSDLTTKYYISFFIFEAALSSRGGCKIIPHSIPHLLKSSAINIFLLPEVVVGSGQQDLAWWIPGSDRKISEGRAPVHCIGPGDLSAKGLAREALYSVFLVCWRAGVAAW